MVRRFGPVPNVYLHRLVFDRDTWEKPSADALNGDRSRRAKR